MIAKRKKRIGMEDLYKMNKIFIKIIILLALLVYANVFADATTRKNNRANKLFKEGKYSDAAKIYLDAQLESPKSDGLNFNLGNANYKLKKYDKAVEYYQKAAGTKDLDLEQKTRFNLGNALYKQGEFEVNQGKQEGLEKLKSSIEAYKRALDINQNDKDAKYNLEYVRKKLKEMAKKQPQEQQPQNQQQQQKKQDQKNEEPKQDKKQQEKNQQQQQKKPGEMSKEEAQKLLDAYKDSEKDAKKKEQQMRARGSASVEKDW